MKPNAFNQRVALVTGAGKGLGRAYALWLARHGATVVVNNRKRPGVPSSAQAVVDEIIAAGGKAFVDEHSVEVEVGAREMIEGAIARAGQLDILVCNAAIDEHFTPFRDISLDTLREIMDINLWGTLYPVHAAWKHMLGRAYGRIILTSSQAGLFGQSASVGYSTSKAAMIGMARALTRDASDAGDADIRINIIAPAAYTPMSSQALDPKWAEFLSPFKVAPVVGWLASEDCRRSGMIFNVGAGRMRRVKVLEGKPLDIPDEDVSALWPALDDMSGAIEASSSFGSGEVLMPELFAADPDMVGKY